MEDDKRKNKFVSIFANIIGAVVFLVVVGGMSYGILVALNVAPNIDIKFAPETNNYFSLEFPEGLTPVEYASVAGIRQWICQDSQGNYRTCEPVETYHQSE